MGIELYCQINVEDQTNTVVIPSPGKGFYTDWRIWVTVGSESALNDLIMSISHTPDDVTVPTEGTVYQAPKTGIYFHMIDSFARFNTGWSKKKIYQRYDSNLYINLGMDQASADVNVIIQASFIPTKGSFLTPRKKISIDAAGFYTSYGHIVAVNGVLRGIVVDGMVVDAADSAVVTLMIHHLENIRRIVETTGITDEDGDQVGADYYSDYTLEYTQAMLMKEKMPSEAGVPKTPSWKVSCNRPVSKGDILVPHVELESGTFPNTVAFEFTYIIQYSGEADNEIQQEWYVFEDEDYLDWGSLDQYGANSRFGGG